MRRLGKKVFVALSGGVDSSVAAALLQKESYFVVGVYMKNWSQPDRFGRCRSAEDMEDARIVAAKLCIPFYVMDFEEEYRKRVVEYMIREYAAGRTPNPDVMCNREIKFGLFLARARALGADFIATGHYIRLKRKSKIRTQKSEKNSKTQNSKPQAIRYKLQTARDTNKDQSYFLWTLNQGQLKYSLFPVGGYTKQKVRTLARKFRLPTAEKKDSQGICFVGEIDLRAFLKQFISVKTGPVFTTTGARVGTHEGAAFYTIGQRHGVGSIGGGIPYYVVDKDIEKNTVRVGIGPHDDELYANHLIAENIHWIQGRTPRLPVKIMARVRYRQPLQEATLFYADVAQTNADIPHKSASSPARIRVIFDESQRAITPGQSVVFYSRKPEQNGSRELLGGGIISD